MVKISKILKPKPEELLVVMRKGNVELTQRSLWLHNSKGPGWSQAELCLCISTWKSSIKNIPLYEQLKIFLKVIIYKVKRV